MSHLKTRALSHAQLIKSLYKRCVRTHEARCLSRTSIRYGAVVIRNMFDQNKNERDMGKIQQIMSDAEETLKKSYQMQKSVKAFDHSPYGIAYGRYVPHDDMILDYWHPMEKAQYPKYFAKRELAKREYVEWWEKTYGNTETKTSQ